MGARTIVANGLNHHVLDVGEGPPVLLLHGFPDSSEIWRHQVPALVAAGFRAVVPDLRGFGKTDIPDGLSGYALPRVLEDLVAILDQLDIARPHLVCHDWGAIVGWTFASTMSARVDRFAALCVGHPNAFFKGGIEQLKHFWYILLFHHEGLAEEALTRDDWALFRQWCQGHPDTDLFIADLARPGRLTAALNWYRVNLPAEVLFRPFAPLPKVRAPTLAIWSTGDDYLVEGPLLNSGEYVEGSWRYERIEAASHFVQVDEPAAVNRLILEHLRGTD